MHDNPSTAAADQHCQSLVDAVAGLRQHGLDRVLDWGRRLASLLPTGSRLLAAGNGGSAAQAQHLTAELVGRYRDERPAYSALALHADTSSVTAVGNDYGFDEVYARQVAAHGRPGDVLMLLSTSGESTNLLRAAGAARAADMRVWALTGPVPNRLSGAADEALCVDSSATATVQETHLLVVHLMCAAFDAALVAHDAGAVPEPAAVAAGTTSTGTATSADTESHAGTEWSAA